MNIDNNIGGSAHQSRSQHIEKRQVESVAAEQPQNAFSGGKISFVNALQSTSLASVLWTVNNDAATDTSAAQDSVEPISQLDSTWFRQAYTEH